MTEAEHPEGRPVTDMQTLSQLDAKEVANTPEFQEWAGEGWQEAGEVVTDGEGPVLFYHGGLPDIETFSTEQTPNTSSEQRGIYFSPRLDQARFFASRLLIDSADRGLPEKASVYAVFLKMKNPYVVAEKGDALSSQKAVVAPEGHDGIVNPKGEEVVVFDPSQIFIAAEAKAPRSH